MLVHIMNYEQAYRSSYLMNIISFRNRVAVVIIKFYVHSQLRMPWREASMHLESTYHILSCSCTRIPQPLLSLSLNQNSVSALHPPASAFLAMLACSCIPPTQYLQGKLSAIKISRAIKSRQQSAQNILMFVVLLNTRDIFYWKNMHKTDMHSVVFPISIYIGLRLSSVRNSS